MKRKYEDRTCIYRIHRIAIYIGDIYDIYVQYTRDEGEYIGDIYEDRMYIYDETYIQNTFKGAYNMHEMLPQYINVYITGRPEDT